MVKSIRKFAALASGERWLLVQAMVSLPLLALAIRVLGPKRCYRGLARIAATIDASESVAAHANVWASRTARLVGTASRHGPVRGNCLVQSMTTWWLLRRQQIDAELRIGVRKQQGRLEAHAWVEHQGSILGDDADMAERYTPFCDAPGVFERRQLETP